MKHLISILLAFIAVTALPAAPDKQTFTGTITDDVCEKADHLLESRIPAIGSRGAHKYLVLSGVAMKQNLIGSQEKHVQRRALLSGQFFEPLSQLNVQLKPH